MLILHLKEKKMENINEKIKKIGIVPVVVIHDAKNALLLSKALIDGGLPIAEITFRTEAAEESIKKITKNYPDMLIGAGTILSIEQVNRAVSAGAKFIVTPGFDPEIVEYCIEKNIVVYPGCVTPSEITQAIKRNLTIVKFFPAEQCGGIETIKAMESPFGQIEFMPTGGININNLQNYLKCDKVAACGGSWMVKSTLIKENKFEEIKKLAKEAVNLVASIRR